jgi:hypothetical protein
MVKCFDDHMKLLGYGITHPYFLFMFKQCGAEVLEFLYCFQDIIWEFLTMRVLTVSLSNFYMLTDNYSRRKLVGS